jgi:hypothetical protein
MFPMERRGSNHFTARHRTNLKTNANTINYSANAARRASLGWKRPSFPLAKGPPGNPILRTCPPRQGYGWENYTVSHERLLNHNIAARIVPRFGRHGIPPFLHPCLVSEVVIDDCDELTNSFVTAAESHSWWRQCHDERDFTKCTRGNPQSVCRMGAAAKPSGNGAPRWPKRLI